MRACERLPTAMLMVCLASYFVGPSLEITVASESDKIPSTAQPSAPQKSVGWLENGSNVYPDATPATEWSAKTNLLWSVSIGSAYSSGILIAGKLFVAAEPSVLACLDTAQGKILWQKNNSYADLPEKVEEAPVPGGAEGTGNAAATPVSDGQFVYECFGSGIVVCYDLQGQRKWITHLTGEALGYGHSASPLLVGGKLLVSFDNLSALDPKTGKEIWKAKNVKEAYGTPAKTKIGGVDVVIVPSGEIVRVSDGAVLASTDGTVNFASPMVHDNMVYFMDASSIALQLPEKVTDKLQVKKLWEVSLEGTFYASSVVAKGLIFSVNEQGNLFIVDAKDGKTLVNKELPFSTKNAPIYGSPTLAGKYVFINNTSGETLVIEAAREYKEVRLNSLGEGSGSAPIFDGKRMFMRGGDKIYCIGEK